MVRNVLLKSETQKTFLFQYTPHLRGTHLFLFSICIGIAQIIHAENQNDAEMPFYTVGLRILSSYLQVAGLLQNFNFKRPASVATLVSIQSGASGVGGQVISFSCLLPQIRGATLFVIKTAATTIVVPLLFALGVLVVWCCIGCCCSRRPGEKSVADKTTTWVDKMIGSLVVLYYLIFPSVLNAITTTLSCTPVDPKRLDYVVEDRTLLDNARDIVCFQDEHVALLLQIALPGFLVFVCFIPLYAMLSMRHYYKKGKLYHNQPHFDARYSYRFGFLFLGYDNDHYGWEVLVLTRKASFVVVAGFLRPSGAIAQVIGAVMILIVALSLHLRHEPYEINGHDNMESVSLHSSLLILMIVLLSAAVSKETDNSFGPWSTTVTIIGVFSATILIFGYSGWEILRNSHNQPGLLGQLSKCLTRAATVRHQFGSEKWLSQKRTGARLGGRRLSVQDVHKAVTIHKVDALEMEHANHHNAIMKKIMQGQNVAKKRLQTRVRLRQKASSTKPSGGRRQHEQKGEKSTKARTKVQPVVAAPPQPQQDRGDQVESLRNIMRDICGTEKRARNMFVKVDTDHSGTLSKKEFVRMCLALLHHNVKKKKKKNISNVEGDVLKFEMVFQSVVWNGDAGEVGEKREMNVEMLVAWLFPHE